MLMATQQGPKVPESERFMNYTGTGASGPGIYGVNNGLFLGTIEDVRKDVGQALKTYFKRQKPSRNERTKAEEDLLSFVGSL